MSIWDELKYFKPEEFDYPEEMDENLLRLLDSAREIAGVGFFISSDYRLGDPRAHGKGFAVDIVDDPHQDGITSQFRWKVIEAAMAAGFKRIGVYDKHIHLDIWSTAPQEVVWCDISL